MRQERSQAAGRRAGGLAACQHERALTQVETGKAIAYSLNRWQALTRFLDDGRICMTNNAAERALRGVAVGRRNWTFAGSDRGGERAAAIYTLIETCQAQRRRSPGLARRRAGTAA